MLFDSVTVKGSAYRGDAEKEYFKALMPGDDLQIEAEPNNEYDPNAVKLLSADGTLHIAYLAKEDAAFIAPELANGKEVLLCQFVELVNIGRALHGIVRIEIAD